MRLMVVKASWMIGGDGILGGEEGAAGVMAEGEEGGKTKHQAMNDDSKDCASDQYTSVPNMG